MKPLLIILTGHAPDAIRARHGDFDHWFRLALGQPARHLHVIDVGAGGALPPPRMCAGAVLSGSASMVTERTTWIESTAAWIRSAMDVSLPLFGVCFGHQLMAQALGGRVDFMATREIGTKDIVRGAETPTHLVPARFRAHTTHRQAIMDLPTGAQALAYSAQDPHQFVRYGARAVSTQFHPEFSAEVMRAYLRLRSQQLHAEGLDVAALSAATAATPQARAMLRDFAREVLHPTATGVST